MTRSILRLIKLSIKSAMSSQSYLIIKYLESEQVDQNSREKSWAAFDHKRALPFKDSPVYYPTLHKLDEIAAGKDVNTTYLLELDMKHLIKREILPGDTIGILPENDGATLKRIFTRLNVEKISTTYCQIEISKDTTKKNASLPKHLPPGVTTLEEIFLKCIDINTPPKKLFLKALRKYTKDTEEIAQFERICSPEGSQEYWHFLETSGRSLLNLLSVFPLCKPPVEFLLENLPPLLPRPYSIASMSPANIMHLIFSVVVHENDGRKGLCTGWLEKIGHSTRHIPIYYRKATSFRIPISPEDLMSQQLILVATGTGIAPFRGLLQQRSLRMNHSFTIDSSGCWVFYGCRYPSQNFFSHIEIDDGNVANGAITKLYLAFSRQTHNDRRYVQHLIEDNGEEVYSWIMSKNPSIYVCGNTNTVNGVKKCFVNIFMSHGGMNLEEAQLKLSKMEKNGKYFVDNWI